MKKIWLILIAVLVLGWLGSIVYSKTINKDATPEEYEVLATTFSEMAMEKVWNAPGYIDSGLDGAITGEAVLNAFPSLLPSDFNNVPAYQGEYSERDGELVFTGNSASNSSYIQPEGFRVLLFNVSERLGIKVNSEARIEKIFDKLEEEN
ncbi:MAG: hypothetical protein WDZ64_00835 [Parcubacteria group bacterium]